MPSDFNEILTFKTVSANIEEFKKISGETHQDEECKYFVSIVPFDKNPDSKFGVKFMSALVETPNEEVFRTKLVRDIVDIYWKQSIPKFIFQFLVYFSFALGVTLYIDYPSMLFAIVMLAF
jgi:hypothetical protein